MPHIPFSLPIFHLGDLWPWEGQHCIPCDCAPPISVTDPGIDIWPKLGHLDTLARIWNRDKEAESFSYAESSCKVMPSWPNTAGQSLMLVSEGKAEKPWISRKSQLANREAEGWSRCLETNRDHVPQNAEEKQRKRKICKITFLVP